MFISFSTRAHWIKKNIVVLDCIVHYVELNLYWDFNPSSVLIITFSYFIFLLTALDGQPYSLEQKKDTLNEFFYRLEDELLSSPEDYLLLTLKNAFIVIEKS